MDEHNVVFTSSYFLSDDNDHVLVLYCSDPRFRQATDEFISSLGLTRYDPIVVPGGSAGTLPTSLTSLGDRGRVKLLYEEHKIKRVIAIAHLDCAFYRHKYTRLSAEDRVKKQLEDLQTFARDAKKITPASIELYYASVKDNRIQFTQIE